MRSIRYEPYGEYYQIQNKHGSSIERSFCVKVIAKVSKVSQPGVFYSMNSTGHRARAHSVPLDWDFSLWGSLQLAVLFFSWDRNGKNIAYMLNPESHRYVLPEPRKSVEACTVRGQPMKGVPAARQICTWWAKGAGGFHEQPKTKPFKLCRCQQLRRLRVRLQVCKKYCSFCYISSS